ncbi:Transcriptional regulator DegU, LuxR family [Caldisalinibacter kiritimatiensis]|uniref:Transcriptional regulator DegU, LuxR family n=2 Tax=Caldisalinibacter kiritimatiensis TaxID=1304284 RepID=R1CFT1_9FIRM|nr:Transcriptional regulator DegU, LuxR family [Caldisalinibacter kiritimatiensis]
MGMCYYEMNKISLAIETLKEAKSGIDSLKLVHMHGLVEKYLFDCYKIINDKADMIEIIEDLEYIFKNLHYPQIKYLLTTMKIKNALALKQKPKKKWIEELELAFQLNPDSIPTFILETLTELKLKGFSEIISKDILIQKLQELQIIKHIPEIQSINLYLAELLYCLEDISACKAHLKNACDIYLEYGLFGQFFNKNLDCYIYLGGIEPALAKELNKNYIRNKPTKIVEIDINENLTNRELEILQLIAKGKSNKEISKALFISIGTTKWHINNIFCKLGVNRRFHAVEKARKLNLIQ